MLKRFSFLFLLVMLYLPLAGQNTIDRSSSLNIFNKGIKLLESNNYAAARSSFEQYIKTDPSSEMLAEAKYYQAYCAMMLFNDDAEYLFENFVEEYPSNSKSMMAYFELGNYYYRNGHLFLDLSEIIFEPKTSLPGNLNITSQTGTVSTSSSVK